MSDVTCFTSSVILAGDDLREIKDQALIVQSGRIIKIGDPEGAEKRVNLNGKLLCPMFIDTHTHVGDTGAKELGVGLPLQKVVNPPDGMKHRFLHEVQGSELHINMMRHALLEMLSNGIIAHADFREQGLEGIRSLRRAARGLPIWVVALGRMTEGASLEQLEIEARAILEEADGLGIRDSKSYPLPLLVQLRSEYPEKIFAAHAGENYNSEMQSRQKNGCGQAGWLAQCHPDFLIHLVYTAPDELRLLADAGIRGVGCPRANGLLGDGQPKLDEWLHTGMHICLGTDNVMFNSPDMLREMDYASRISRGQAHDPAVIDSRAILQAATVEGARALRLDDDLGSLAAGKEASFIVFDLQSLNLTYQHDVVSTIVHRATPADICAIYIKGERMDVRAFM